MDDAARQDSQGETSGASGYLTIDLEALARNYERLKAEVAPAQAAAVVKADAYGLGADRVAPKLYEHGCRHFFVAQFVEALKLRPLLADDARIFVLNGLQPGTRRPARATASCLSSTHWSIGTNGPERRGRSAAGCFAVLQFDTGMSRLGVPPEERETLAGLVAAEDAVEVLFVMSHLASADEPDSPQERSQRQRTQQVAATFPRFDLCFANSGGIFLGKAYHGVLVRPGVALYGGAPVAGRPNPMDPVVRLDIAVVQTRIRPAGARVGYSGTHVTTGETRLATIAAGYADGLPRSLSGRGAAWVRRRAASPSSGAFPWTASPSIFPRCRRAASRSAAASRYSARTRRSRTSPAMRAQFPTKS